jgi:hypothetical protein
VTGPSAAGPSAAGAVGASAKQDPLYWRVLRLKHIRPNGWQRALLVEGVLTLAAVLTLADVATAWTLVVLPLVAAGIAKTHDVLAGYLGRSARPAASPSPAPHLADMFAPYESVHIIPANMTTRMRTAPEPEGSDAVEEVESVSSS